MKIRVRLVLLALLAISAPASAQPAAEPMERDAVTAGNRVARARALFEEADFDGALRELAPLRDQTLPAEIGVRAALLETNALVGLRRMEPAIASCRRAVVLARHDPEVARDESPRVQEVCTTAAEQARRDLVEERSLLVGETRVTTERVAWNPIRIEVELAGNLEGLIVQAEVTLGDEAPRVVTFSGDAPMRRAATLDSSEAVPGREIQVTSFIRDAFGILARAAQPTTIRIPRAQAGVRFATGTDEGSLSVDGMPTNIQAEVGTFVPVSPGSHELEIATEEGTTARTRVSLERGEVALVTLRSEAELDARKVVAWGSVSLAGAALVTGVVLQFLADARATELERLSNQREPDSGLPVINYADVESTDDARRSLQTFSIGFFIGAGVLAAIGTTMFLVSSSDTEEAPPARARAHRSGTRASSPPMLGIRF